MIIQLLDYLGNKHLVIVPDDTKKLHIKIISGDMVLLAPVYYDTGKDSRIINFYDGEYVIERKYFDKLSSIDSACSLYDLIDNNKISE